jgi:hypothetical protein
LMRTPTEKLVDQDFYGLVVRDGVAVCVSRHRVLE